MLYSCFNLAGGALMAGGAEDFHGGKVAAFEAEDFTGPGKIGVPTDLKVAALEAVGQRVFGRRGGESDPVPLIAHSYFHQIFIMDLS
jgi:hypothetical protein